jgi:predicted dehydrogenase/threonine dehydrogenase-like Zn-dependent dehydrogenase
LRTKDLKLMKAVIQSYRGGTPTVTNVPSPALQPGGILVRNAVSLVSAGTERLMVDLAQKSLLGKAWARPDLAKKVFEKVRRDGLVAALDTVRTRLDVPIPLGYSSAGTVLAVGAGVRDFKPGDRVACAGAGYANHAEVIFVPQHLAAPLGAEVDFESAAFTTVGAIALQGLRLAKLELGETVAVIGLGLVGLLAAQLARAAGCRVVGMDTDSERCHLARALGLEAAVTEADDLNTACLERSAGHGADKVIVAAATPSSQPVALAGRIARSQGTVVVVGAVGLEIPRQPYFTKELIFRISCSYGPGRYDLEYEEKGRDYPIGHVRWTENRNLRAFVQQLQTGRVEAHPLMTHRFPITEAEKAYRLLTDKDVEPSLGILLTYPQEAPTESTSNTLFLSQPHETEPSPPADRVRLGVLGAGQFASGVLLPVIANLPRIELVGVCNATGIKAQHVGRRFGFRFATTDPEEILQHSEIDTVLIATRHHLHAPQVLAALTAGKHIFVEKPLCLTTKELNQIITTYGECGKESKAPVLMMGFNRRFAPMTRKLVEFLQPLNEPMVMHYRVNAGFIPPEHWTQDPEQGGGRIQGEVCHFVDFLSFLAGDLPTTIEARSLPNAGRYRDDNLVVTLTFPDGSLGTVTYVANGDSTVPKERCEIFCGGAVAVLDNFRRLELTRGGRKRVETARLTQDKGHHAQLKIFFDAIRKHQPAPIPFEQIIGVTRTTLAISQKLRQDSRS